MTKVAAQRLDPAEFKAQEVAGSFYVALPHEEGETFLHFCCPCGCGAKSQILIGIRHKPEDSPSWEWNGSTTDITLTPSINFKSDHWHGYLTDGVWTG